MRSEHHAAEHQQRIGRDGGAVARHAWSGRTGLPPHRGCNDVIQGVHVPRAHQGPARARRPDTPCHACRLRASQWGRRAAHAPWTMRVLPSTATTWPRRGDGPGPVVGGCVHSSVAAVRGWDMRARRPDPGPARAAACRARGRCLPGIRRSANPQRTTLGAAANHERLAIHCSGQHCVIAVAQVPQGIWWSVRGLGAVPRVCSSRHASVSGRRHVPRGRRAAAPRSSSCTSFKLCDWLAPNSTTMRELPGTTNAPCSYRAGGAFRVATDRHSSVAAAVHNQIEARSSAEISGENGIWFMWYENQRYHAQTEVEDVRVVVGLVGVGAAKDHQAGAVRARGVSHARGRRGPGVVEHVPHAPLRRVAGAQDGVQRQPGHARVRRKCNCRLAPQSSVRLRAGSS